MDIKINGEIRRVADGIHLDQLLQDLRIVGAGLAIEHNGRFIEDESEWKTLALAESDVLEIVRFVGGG